MTGSCINFAGDVYSRFERGWNETKLQPHKAIGLMMVDTRKHFVKGLSSSQEEGS